MSQKSLNFHKNRLLVEREENSSDRFASEEEIDGKIKRLRQALIGNQFIVYYQPIVDTNTGKIVRAESLIRWNHPELGIVPPGDFLPLAEETGLIISIGKWIERKVCEQLVSWREAGIPLIPISINISAQQFLQQNFIYEVRQLLNYNQLDGSLLVFEISETSLMMNEDSVIETLKELKKMGIKTYIDHFGTGFSSLSYLNSFKLDGIKIDRSFIREISSRSENAAITSALIKMGQQLNINVIAEGVETEEDLLFLREFNCHKMQGFYFCKPCPNEEFEQVLMKSKVNPFRVENIENSSIKINYPLQSEMTFINLAAGKMDKGELLIENIGPGGLRFLSNLKLIVDQEVIYSFETDTAGRINLSGVIIWDDQLPDGQYQYGVHFNLPEDKRTYLTQILNDHSEKYFRSLISK